MRSARSDDLWEENSMNGNNSGGFWRCIATAALLAGVASAQNGASPAGADQTGNTPPANVMQMNFAGMFLMNQASGTSMNPQSWPMPMLMHRAKSWNLMAMGQAYLVDVQQSGPRGGDKFYSGNWFMGAAEHSVGRGSFLIETMLSLDPATITNRRYPELFQTGETAFGQPIVDGQHPHNFVMSLGIHYAHRSE